MAVDIANEMLQHSQLLTHACEVPPTDATAANQPPATPKAAGEELMDESEDAAVPKAAVTEEDDDLDMPLLPTLRSTPNQARELLSILLSRCSDKGATVRAKALTSLATSLELASRDETVQLHFFQLLSTWSASPANAERQEDTSASLFQSPVGSNASISDASLRDVSGVLSPVGVHKQSGLRQICGILRLRSTDARPVVRKAALSALLAILLMAEPDQRCWTPSDLQVLFDGCMDISLSIRKLGMTALSRLLAKYPDDADLNKVWLGAVLPLVMDAEITVQEDALRHVDELILQPMHRAIKADTDSTQSPVWNTLAALDDEMTTYLQRALKLMVRRNMFPTALLKTFNKIMATSRHIGVWIVMEELTASMPDKCDVRAMLGAWATCIKSTAGHAKDNRARTVRVLQCVGNVAHLLGREEGAELAAYLFGCLTDFAAECPPTLLKAMVRTLKLVSSSLHDSQQALPLAERIVGPEWEAELVKLCTSGLESFVSRSHAQPHDEESVIRFLFMLGEVVLHTDAEVPNLAKTLVHTMISTHISANLMSSSQPNPNQTPAAGARAGDVAVPTQVRAHAFVTLGKMCLKDEAMAKQLMPTMVGELQDGTSPVVQNNILVIMCDFARTYTAVVDNYVPSMTFCLQSPHELVRQHTLLILTQLLQEDYLKWKSSLFFRFLTSIVDPSPTVRKMAEQNFRTTILTKAPNKFYVHFIETVFFLNACTKHSVYNQFDQENDTAFALPHSPRRRLVLYQFLLGFMSDTQKFQAAAKLCQDVLGSVVDGGLSLTDPTVHDVVKDTLLVLASKEIKIKSGGRSSAAEEDEDLEAPALSERDQKAAAAKGKILSKLMKKTTLENVVPVLIELKRLLEARQSPLLKHLMLYLVELTADYKQELEDVLAADRQLATELQYDLRQFAQDQKAAEQHQELRRLSVTPKQITGLTPRRTTSQPMSTSRAPAAGSHTPGSLKRTQSLAAGTPRSGGAISRSSSATPRSGSRVPVPVFATPRLSASKAEMARTPNSEDERENVSADLNSPLAAESDGSKPDVLLATPGKAPKSSLWKVGMSAEKQVTYTPHTCAHIRTHLHTQVHANKQTHTHTHTHTHDKYIVLTYYSHTTHTTHTTHAHTRTHIYTHTYTQT
jgi:condensin-2 complex subunit D3